jgi:hypothetical protein
MKQMEKNIRMTKPLNCELLAPFFFSAVPRHTEATKLPHLASLRHLAHPGTPPTMS